MAWSPSVIAVAAGCEGNLQKMHTATQLSPAAGLAESNWGPAAPTTAACRKLLAMALAQHSWQAAAMLALAMQSALPEEAQAGLTAAFDGARQSAMQPSASHGNIVGDQTEYKLDLSSSSSRQAQGQDQGDAVQLAGLLQRQVCATLSVVRFSHSHASCCVLHYAESFERRAMVQSAVAGKQKLQLPTLGHSPSTADVHCSCSFDQACLPHHCG